MTNINPTNHSGEFKVLSQGLPKGMRYPLIYNPGPPKPGQVWYDSDNDWIVIEEVSNNDGVAYSYVGSSLLSFAPIYRFYTGQKKDLDQIRFCYFCESTMEMTPPLLHAHRELNIVLERARQEVEKADPNDPSAPDELSLTLQAEASAVVLSAIKELAKLDSSQMALGYCIDCIETLANFCPLTPLTGADDEWDDIPYDPSLMQNTRCPQVFKNKETGVCTLTDFIIFSEDGGHTSFSGTVSFDEGVLRSVQEIKFPYLVFSTPPYLVDLDSDRKEIKRVREMRPEGYCELDDQAKQAWFRKYLEPRPAEKG